MGWDVNVHVNLRQQLMLRTRGVGGGGVGWDVNVHVKLRQQLMLRTPGPGQYIYIYIYRIYLPTFLVYLYVFNSFSIDVYTYIINIVLDWVSLARCRCETQCRDCWWS